MTCTVSKSDSCQLNLNAIAKGYIVGRLTDVLKSIPGVSAGLVNLGGDMAAFGAAIGGLDFQVVEALKFHTDEGLPVM